MRNKSHHELGLFKLLALIVSGVVVVAVLGLVGIQYTQAAWIPAQMRTFFQPSPSKRMADAENPALSKSGRVLAANDQVANPQRLVIAIPSVFQQSVQALSATVQELLTTTDLIVTGTSNIQGELTTTSAVSIGGPVSVAGTLSVTGESTFGGDITADGQNLDLGSGELTAGNVLYSLTAGGGIEVGSGQTPTIINTDRGTSQLIFKTIKVGADSFAAGSNTDTLEFSSNSPGITITSDTGAKKVIFDVSAGDINASGWEISSSDVILQDVLSNVGIGIAVPTEKLHVVGNALIDGDLTVTGATDLQGGTVIANGINNSLGGITNAGAITGATGITSSGPITLSGLGAGIVKSSLAGILSSGAIDLSSSEVSSTLGVARGGTGVTSYTTGDLLYATGASSLGTLNIGGDGEVLTVESGALAWASLTGGGGLCPTCLINNPNATQTIIPTGATTTGLSIQQASGGTADIFNVTDATGATKYLRVDNVGNVMLGAGTLASTGNLTVSPASTDPISISPVAEGAAAYTGTITSLDLTDNRTWSYPDATGTVCLTTGNCNGVGGNFGGSGGIGYIPKFQTTTSVTNSQIFDDGTNVGINDVTPSYRLDVNGTGRFVGALSANSTLGVTGATTLSDTLQVSGAGSFLTTLGVTGATTLSDTLGVTGVATFNSSASVTNNFTVDTDTFLVNASTNTIGIGASAAASSKLYIFRNTTGSGLTIRNEATSGTNYGIGSSLYGTGTGTYVAGSFNALGTGINNINLMLGNVAVPTTNNYDVYAGSTGWYNYFAGNVGIGVTAPQDRLDILGAIRLTGDVDNDTSVDIRRYGSTSRIATIAELSDAGVATFGYSGLANSRIYLDGGAGGAAANINLYDTSNVLTTKIIATGDSYFNGGDVGIGTASPDAKLHINADASGIGQIIRANATTPGDLSVWQNSSGTTLASMTNIGGVNLLGIPTLTFQKAVTINGYDKSHWFTVAGTSEYFGGNRENILFSGWNVTGNSGVRHNNAESSLYTAIETDFYTDAINHFMEWYVEYYPADGDPAGARRPFQTSINRYNDEVLALVNADNLLLRNGDGSQTYYQGINGLGKNFVPVEMIGQSTSTQLVVKGYSVGQTNPVFQVQDHTGGGLFSVSNDGKLNILNTASGSTFISTDSITYAGAIATVGAANYNVYRDTSGPAFSYTTGLQSGVNVRALSQNAYSRYVYGSSIGVNMQANPGYTASAIYAYGLDLVYSLSGSGTKAVGVAAGIHVGNFAQTGTTTGYGIQIEDQTGAGTAYSLVTNAGNVVFNEGGNAATNFRIEGDTNSNLFYVQSSTDRIGVGTTSPNALLHVNGDAQIGVTSTGYYQIASGATNYFNSVNAPLYFGTSGTNDLTLRTNSTARVTINDSTGNVGIGTTTAGSRLTVATSGTDVLSLTNSIGAYTLSGYTFQAPSSYLIRSGGSGYLTLGASGDSIKFEMGASEIARFASNGNLGIGTNNPVYKLHVANIANNASQGIYLSDVLGRASGLTPSNGGTGVPWVGSMTNDSFSLGANNAEAMRILTSGYVGIGTAIPSNMLHVKVPAGVGTAVAVALEHGDNSGAGWGIGTGFSGYYGNRFIVSRTDGNTPLNIDTSTVYLGGADSLGTPTARVNATGVGIGVSPGAQLHTSMSSAPSLADGNTNIRLGYAGGYAAGSGGAQITFAQEWDSGAPGSIIRVGAVRGFKSQGSGSFGGGVQLLYQPASSADMGVGMTLEQNGRVGIGTSSPAELLHVAGHLRLPKASTLNWSNGSGGDYSDSIRVDDSPAWLASDNVMTFSVYDNHAGTGAWVFRGADTAKNVMTIKGYSGYVGVANSAPGAYLHVGSSSITDSTTLLRLEDANSTCNFTADSGSPSCGSDLTLKKDVFDLDTSDLLTRVTSLRPVSYRWNTDGVDAPNQYGFIAQEVAAQFPNLVTEGQWVDGTTRKFLNMGGLMPYVVGAVREQQTLIGGLQLALDEQGDILAGSVAGVSTDADVESMLTRIALVEAEQASTSATLDSFAGMATWTTEMMTFLKEVTMAGRVFFQGTVDFLADVTFRGRVTHHDQDTAGFITFEPGEVEAVVVFTRAYSEKPVITLTSEDGLGTAMLKNVSGEGFTVILSDAAAASGTVTWQAVLVNDARVTRASPGNEAVPTPTPSPSADPSPTPVASATPEPIATPIPTPSASPDVSPSPIP